MSEEIECPHGAVGEEVDLCPPCQTEAAQEKARLIAADRRKNPSRYFGSAVVHRGRTIAREHV